MQDSVVIIQDPNLKDPAMIAGFGGWPNAGEVSTWVASYLLKAFGGTECAEIRPEPFFDLSERRPLISVEGGRIKKVEYPRCTFYAVSSSDPNSRDLVLFSGQEPHLCWPQFSDSFLDVAQRLSVVEIFAIGGLFDNIPHTVEPRVSGVTNRDENLERFHGLGIHPGEYDGPGSITSQIVSNAAKRNLPMTTLWGHVPYYIQSNNARTSLAILERLRSLIGFDLDLGEVHRASEMLDEQIEKIIKSKPELRDYIKNLEQDYLQGSGISADQITTTIVQEPSLGDKIIRIDPFLRKS
jgi:proteasome assembly chaperone (PAC2) family protein